MKKICFVFILLPFFALAQNPKYLTHTVAAKESLSSIGRQYNINGRELAKFNNIDYEKGLSLGQVLKIPATAKPATITKEAEKKDVPVKAESAAPKSVAVNGTPIYHTVAKKETLYHISTLYNKVTIVDIKKWNNLTSDGVSEGAQLIVGYRAGRPVNENNPVGETKPQVVKEAAVRKQTAETKQQEVSIAAPIVPKENNVVKNSTAPATPSKIAEGGFFKTIYVKSGKAEQSGQSGSFKSTSGWEDGKYYCLHNEAIAGAIIKITNTTNNKTIYAKVLDVMPDIKQNSNLVLLVSDAAATALGAGATNFACVINF